MARHKVHRLIDLMYLGRQYPQVHRWVDAPYKRLGKRHRILRHDLLSAVIIALKLRDANAFRSAVLHYLTDGVEL